MQYITNENYEELTSNNRFVVIDFYADWCGPCQMYSPIFESAASTYKDALLVKCDLDKSKRVAARFGIRSIPTTVIVENKKAIAAQHGVIPEKQLISFIDQNIKKDKQL